MAVLVPGILAEAEKAMDDIKLALLGDHEAARRLTEAGVLVPCPFCERDTVAINLLGTWWCRCMNCGVTGPIKSDEPTARLAWNTRAPILSAEELKKLEEEA